MTTTLTPSTNCHIATINHDTLIDGNSIEAVGLELLEAAAVANYKLVVDFSRVEAVSSALLGKLIALRKRCRDSKGRLALCSCGEHLVEAMKVTGLRRLFDVFDGWPEAVAFMGIDAVSWREDVA